ncbi:MAG: CoB--CoM heterodisulfide reductase iron-sulfur subunit A family protein [Acidilobaceae archaeon]
MPDEPRIGVYVCHCGTNIAGLIDVKEVVRYASTLPNVVIAREYIFMCSEPGQELIVNDIKEYNLNRVVVAACSPSLHEVTFRNAVMRGGLNPYLFEMVNIREHSSWVHIDRREATEKAKDLIRMAVAKAALLEPLEEARVSVAKNALVIGGGAAGIRSALDLARAGFNVYLVERKPTLGGHTARIPLIRYLGIRGDELVKSAINELVKIPNIKAYVNSEIDSVEGSAGNFKVKIRIKPRLVNSKCTLCGECVKVCPIEVPNEYEYGIVKRKAIYIPFEGAYPPIYAIDLEACTKCGECVKVCPVGAIDLSEQERIEEVEVGAIILATGYDPYDPEKGELGYGLSNKVITLFQLHRLLDERGVTKGRLVVNGSVPRRIAFISCIGSLRTTPRSYKFCSRMCCSAMLSAAIKILEQIPDASIYVLHKDIRTYGYDEDIYWAALEKGVRFVRYKETPEVEVQGEDIRVYVRDITINEYLEIPSDLVVLVVGMAPGKYMRQILDVIKVSCGEEGFVNEAHLKLRPVEAPSRGIFLAGAVTGPKSVIESIIHGSAAASRALSIISKDLITGEAQIATVNEDLCSGCRICIGMCPYNAISLKQVNGRTIASVNPLLCAACGTCAAACPSGAMQQRGFKDVQLIAQVRAFRG